MLKKLKKDIKEYYDWSNNHPIQYYSVWSIIFSLFMTLRLFEGSYGWATFNGVIVLMNVSCLFLEIKKKRKVKKVRN